jgi:hypothetical protein
LKKNGENYCEKKTEFYSLNTRQMQYDSFKTAKITSTFFHSNEVQEIIIEPYQPAHAFTGFCFIISILIYVVSVPDTSNVTQNSRRLHVWAI